MFKTSCFIQKKEKKRIFGGNKYEQFKEVNLNIV